MQFRYYGKDDERNYPNIENYYVELTSKNIFEKYNIISKLGIQCRPGIHFYLNGSSYPIEVGQTGIYELDLEGYGQINSIRFAESDGNNLKGIDTFGEEKSTDRLLIDIVYEGVGVN
jgi:hypothetical protein